MVAWAVSPRKSWLTPLAVLVPILATPLVAIWLTPKSTVAGLVVLVLGLVAISVAGHFTYGRRRSVVSAVLTWVTMVGAYVAFVFISIDSSICGKNIATPWEWLAPTGAVLAYYAVAGWGLNSRRAVWAAPLGFAAGFVVLVVLLLVVPGTAGYCET